MVDGAGSAGARASVVCTERVRKREKMSEHFLTHSAGSRRLLNRFTVSDSAEIQQRRSAFRSSALLLFSSWLECDRTNQRPFEEARGRSCRQ